MNANERIRVFKEIFTLRKKQSDKERLKLLSHVAPEINWNRHLVQSAPTSKSRKLLKNPNLNM
jgi:hypothetical protein